MTTIHVVLRVLVLSAVVVVVGCAGRYGADTVAPGSVVIGEAPRKSDPFEVNEARIAGNTLIVNVSYGGGCAVHVFRAWADDAFRMTDPVGLAIAITHDARGDPCERWVTEDIQFDLTPVRNAYQEDSGVIRLILDPAPPGDGDLTYRF